MKVETGIKSGAVMDGAAAAVSQAAGSVQSFLAQAGQQADGFTNQVANKATAVWNALVSG